MEKKLNAAIIGFGRSGQMIHGAYFASEANQLFHVTAVVDELEIRREQAKAMLGCEVFADYHEILDRHDIDLIINSTYSHLHYPVALDFLNHGFNVVTEKPFAVHKEQCDAMIEAAKKNNVMLCVFQQSHFAPYYRKIREIVDSGVLGRIVEIRMQFSNYSRRWDWQATQRCGGGVLLNKGPHPLEQALDLLDSDELPQVISFLDIVNSFGDAEDFAKVILRVPGKPLIDLELSQSNKCADFNYIIEGEYGTLKATTGTVDYYYYDPKEAPEQKLILDSLQGEHGEPLYCSEKLPWNHVKEELTGDAFDTAPHLYYTNIYRHLTNGEELVIKPERIRQMIEIIDEIHRQNPLPVKF